MTIKILLCGHSFIKRFKNFITENRPDYSYSLNLNPHDFMVQYSGISGGKVHNLWNIEDIHDFAPQIRLLFYSAGQMTCVIEICHWNKLRGIL